MRVVHITDKNNHTITEVEFDTKEEELQWYQEERSGQKLCAGYSSLAELYKRLNPYYYQSKSVRQQIKELIRRL